jgi:hypothetical protein
MRIDKSNNIRNKIEAPLPKIQGSLDLGNQDEKTFRRNLITVR